MAFPLIIPPCQLLTVVQIDWDTVQVVTNYKDVHITKMMFRRLLGKIKGTPGSSKTTAASASKPQGISKSTPSKGSRGRKQKPISDLIAAEEAGPEDVVQAVVPEEGYDGNTGSGAVAQDLDEGGQFPASC